MRDSLFALRAAGFSALLATVGTAQNLESLQAVQGTVKDAGTFHVATQTWTRSTPTTAIGPDVLYNNSVLTGYFGVVREDQWRTDEGRIPSLNSEGNADTYVINGIGIGYCTNQTNPLTANVAIFGSHSPCTDPLTTGTLAGGVAITGIPTTATAGTQGCWLVTVDLMGTSLEFNVTGDQEGVFDGSANLDDIGISLNMVGHANDGTTGWLICGDPANAPFGDGTKAAWGFGPGPDGTGLAQQDLYWVDDNLATGGLADGCYWYGGYPANPWGGYREILFGDKVGTGATSYCDPPNGNSLSTGGCVIADTGGFGSSNATFSITDTPTQPALLYAGPNQLDLPFGCGRRCIGGTVIRGTPFTPGATSTSASFDMSPANAVNIQYWYRDPANFMACGDAFNLSNALMP